MPKILRQPEGAGAEAELVDDTAGEQISQADFLKDPDGLTAGGRKVAVRVAPADAVEALAPHLAHVALVAIDIPSPGEGRGYTYARLLRQRFGFKGEIRAVGAAVKQDLLFFLLRCGFNTFELVATENLTEAREQLHRFTLAYQPAVPRADVRQARFTAAR